MDLLVEGGPSVPTELVARTVHETAGLFRRTAPHGRGFGLMMAIGSLLVLVTAALIVPGMALLGRRDADPREAWGERLLDVPLDRSAAMIVPFRSVRLALVGLSMLGGLSGNLVILPLLLSRLVRPAARTSVDDDGDRPRSRPIPPPGASGSSGT